MLKHFHGRSLFISFSLFYHAKAACRRSILWFILVLEPESSRLRALTCFNLSWQCALTVRAKINRGFTCLSKETQKEKKTPLWIHTMFCLHWCLEHQRYSVVPVWGQTLTFHCGVGGGFSNYNTPAKFAWRRCTTAHQSAVAQDFLLNLWFFLECMFC